MDREKLIAEIMKEAEADGEPVTRAEAEEMANMELGNKENRRYETSDKPRKPREKKVDADKLKLISLLYETVLDIDVTAEVANPEREITFSHNGAHYSFTLTKHRPKKG